MCKQNNDQRVGDRQQLVKCFYIHFVSSYLFQPENQTQNIQFFRETPVVLEKVLWFRPSCTFLFD